MPVWSLIVALLVGLVIGLLVGRFWGAGAGSPSRGAALPPPTQTAPVERAAPFQTSAEPIEQDPAPSPRIGVEPVEESAPSAPGEVEPSEEGPAAAPQIEVEPATVLTEEEEPGPRHEEPILGEEPEPAATEEAAPVIEESTLVEEELAAGGPTDPEIPGLNQEEAVRPSEPAAPEGEAATEEEPAGEAKAPEAIDARMDDVLSELERRYRGRKVDSDDDPASGRRRKRSDEEP